MSLETIELPEIAVVGLKGTFISASHEGSNAPQVIGPLWAEMSQVFFQLDLAGLELRKGIGAMWPTESGKPGEMHYFAGYELSGIPEDVKTLEVLTIPAAKYAAVVHRGSLDGLPATTVDFYTNILPASGIERSAGFDLEIYGDNDENGMPTTVTICAPIK